MKNLINVEEVLEQLDKTSILYNYLSTNPSLKIFSLFPSTENKKSGIYCIFTLHNSKVYIGSAKNFQYRFRKHRYLLVNNKHHSKYLQNSYNKYKKDDFLVFIIEETLELENKEFLYIKMFNAVKEGYNATEDTQRNFYDETLISNNKMRRSIPVIALDLKGNFIKRFASVSDAAKAYNDQSTNISKCCNGKSRLVKNTMFIYEKDYNPEQQYFLKERSFTHQKSDRMRKLTSERMKGKVISLEQRLLSSIQQGIKILCETDGLSFRSLKHAGKYYNINPTSIKSSIEQNRLCKNLKFIYQ
jgi:hypothetical protein